MALELTLGVGAYDRTIPLADGTVAPEGIELKVSHMNPGELFRLQARSAPFDVAEFSLSTYCMLLGRGDDRFVGIPVFPSRMFRHRSIFINTNAGIRRAEDLAGKRIGSPEFQQTAGVWIRGFLEDDHGVRQEDVAWRFGSFNEPGPYHERAPVKLPDNLSHEVIPETTSLAQELERGAIDAIISAQAPASLGRSPNVARLFPDYPVVEKDYFRRTGFFPIMHTVVIRRSIYEAHPWIAASLFEAFMAAKRVGTARLAADGTPYAGLPWLTHHLEEQAAVMGPDPYVYGYGPSLANVEGFLRMSHRQGLTPRVLDPAELFVEEVRSA
jgi:4,5-dihydroxyphthalate decarboxylase